MLTLLGKLLQALHEAKDVLHQAPTLTNTPLTIEEQWLVTELAAWIGLSPNVVELYETLLEERRKTEPLDDAVLKELQLGLMLDGVPVFW